ncbi:MAG: flagella basal body P-ring formation protein FlgA [Thermodesulfovibrio sp.]|nr:flagella basal body P-ring formation protein FlgA [Thermodesulfovibrio sp.]
MKRCWQAISYKLQAIVHTFQVAAFFTLLLILTGSSFASGISIEGILKDYITTNYPWAEVDISDVQMNAAMPGGRPERILLERGLPGKTVFIMEFKNDRRYTVSANVKAFDRVVMSRRAFKKGSFLQKDDLYVTLMDVTRLPKNAVSNPEMVMGRPLSRSIVANMPFVSDMLSDTAQMRKGQRVALVFEAKGMSITALGELKENAAVGTYAKAINLSSKKIVAGILTDENTIRVEF